MQGPSNPGRRSSRFLAGLTAVLHGGTDDHECRALDLNRHGVLLTGPFPAPEAPEVRVSLTSAAGDLVLDAVGRVVHVAPDEEHGGKRLGLQFDDLDPAQTEVLEALVARVVEGRVPAPLAQLEPDAPVADVRRALEQIPLAHRIQLAARALPCERGFLFQDSNLQVLEALTRNPNITLPEVANLARKPNLLPTTLDLLSKDPRWAGSEELKLLIAGHPRVTLATAERVSATLSANAMVRLVRKPGLHPSLKTKLLAKIPRKQQW